MAIFILFSNFVSFLPQSFQDNKLVEIFKVNKALAAFTVAAGTVAPLGIAAMGTPIINVSQDDSNQAINLPFTFNYYGVALAAFIGSNSYLTFGAGSNAYSGLSCTNPLRALNVGSADNSWQRYYRIDNGDGSVRVRFEGNNSTSGTVGSPTIVWEATLYNDGKIQLAVGAHSRTAGLNNINNGVTGATCIGYTLAANQSYVFEPSGSTYIIHTGSNVISGPVVPTTTIGNGTNPASATIAPGAPVTDLNNFSVKTNESTDTITALTVTLPAGTAASLSLIEITNTSNGDVCTDVANPGTDAVAFTGCNIPASTTLVDYKVRITPKTHANMPAPPGLSYAVTGIVTAITSTLAKSYSDSSATITVDNLSPNNVTVPSASVVGGGQITVNYTNPAGSDLHSVIVLRNTVAITGIPTEGATYTTSAGSNLVGNDTVACVDGTIPASTTDSCIATDLVNGTTYYFKIFVRDTSGNYSASGLNSNPRLLSSVLRISHVPAP